MASPRFHNLMLLLCIIAILNNHVTLTVARQLQNSPIVKEAEPNYGGQNNGGEDHQVQKNSSLSSEKEEQEAEKEAPNVGGANHQVQKNSPSYWKEQGAEKEEAPNDQVMDGPSKNNNNQKKPKVNLNDQKQIPFPFPFPYPTLPLPPVIPGLPMPAPLIPPPLGINPYTFPPLDISGVVPSPP